jgi:hypothetical protein
MVWDAEMTKTAREIWTSDKNKGITDLLKGTKLGDLTDPNQIGQWIRTYDEAHNGIVEDKVRYRAFRKFQTDGTFGDYQRNIDGKPAEAAHNSNPQNAKAILMLMTGGDRQKISDDLGTEVHKVRSFYNNIISPWDEDGDTTMDTHAIGAAWVRAISNKYAAVIHGLGSTPDTKSYPPGWKSSLDSAPNGSFGLYGIYADAYRELAEERGMLANQVQAIIWTVKRDAFANLDKRKIKSKEWTGFGTGAAAAVLERAQTDVERIESLWHSYNRGFTSLHDTRDAVWAIAQAANAREKARREAESERLRRKAAQ